MHYIQFEKSFQIQFEKKYCVQNKGYSSAQSIKDDSQVYTNQIVIMDYKSRTKQISPLKKVKTRLSILIKVEMKA